MADKYASPDAPLTLAALRRRGTSRRAAPQQPELFAGLFDPPGEPEAHHPSQHDAGATSAPDRAAEPQPGPGSLAAPSSSDAWRAGGLPRPQTVSVPALAPVPVVASVPADGPSPEPVPRTWTVSGLVRHVRGVVERGYGQVTVEGEISNWRPAGSGHCYYVIKDSNAQLSAVIFRRQASLLRFRPSDGDAVRVHGQLSVYESRGQMQLIVEWMEQVGLGALLAEVQRLKERLRQEGLFDRKRPLPAFPRCIGIVTSLHGAALRDIIKVCRRRHAAVQILIYPAAVQGPNCPVEVAAGLRWFSAHADHAEVVLVARGGGSWEDLHGFDHEMVARAIAASVLPVLTGIGHAPDATIADAAADVCAPTPSAAAELLTASHHRVEERVTRLHARLHRAGYYELLRAGQRLARLSATTVLRRVEDGLNRRAQRVDELGFRAGVASRHQLRRTEARLLSIGSRLGRQNPLERLGSDKRRLDGLRNRLERASNLRLNSLTRRSEMAANRLSALSPLRVLDRGYALVYGPDGQLLRSAESVGSGEVISARLAAGKLRARTL